MLGEFEIIVTFSQRINYSGISMLSNRHASEQAAATGPLAGEGALLQLVLAGDMDAFTSLYLHYYPRLYRFIYFINQQHEDTEEILQDVFLKIWDKRESLCSVRSFEDYLFRMAKNRLVDLVRKSQSGLKAIHHLRPVEQELNSPTEEAVAYREYHRLAREAITRLPEKKRTVFLMSAEDGLSLDEIAARLNISRSAVKKHLHTATVQIKAYLRSNAEWTVGVLAAIFLRP